MTETNSLNLNSLNKRLRDDTIRQIDETYNNDLKTAASTRERAMLDAATAKQEAIRQAQAALEPLKNRWKEARDQVESKLRKQELDNERAKQELILIKAEETREKAFKYAEMLSKHLANEAAEKRRLAIKQISINERITGPEGGQTLKSQKQEERSKIEEERKIQQETKLKAEQALQAQKESELAKAKEERKAIKVAKEQSGKAKTLTNESVKEERNTKEALVEIVGNSGEDKSNSASVAKISKEQITRLQTAKPIESAKPPVEIITPVIPGAALMRTGNTKLSFTQNDASSDNIVEFEKQLRNIPDLRLVMIGGTADEGVQIIVSSEKTVPLSDILRRLLIIEEVTDRPADIFVTFKPSFSYEGKISS